VERARPPSLPGDARRLHRSPARAVLSRVLETRRPAMAGIATRSPAAEAPRDEARAPRSCGELVPDENRVRHRFPRSVPGVDVDRVLGRRRLIDLEESAGSLAALGDRLAFRARLGDAALIFLLGAEGVRDEEIAFVAGVLEDLVPG